MLITILYNIAVFSFGLSVCLLFCSFCWGIVALVKHFWDYPKKITKDVIRYFGMCHLKAAVILFLVFAAIVLILPKL